MPTSESPSRSSVTNVREMALHWRTRLLNNLLLVSAAIGLPTTLLGVMELNDGSQAAIWLMALYLAAYGAVVAVTFVRRIGYTVRGLVLLAVLLAIGMLSLWRNGLPGEGRVFLVAFVVLASALFGLRGGIISSLVMSGAMMGIAWRFSQGQLSMPVELLNDLNTLSNWSIALVVQLLVTSLALASFAYLFRQMTGAASQALENANHAEASARVADERAAALEVQTLRLRDTERQLRDLVGTLETPTVQLADQILLAPLVGQIDANRAETLLSRLLMAVSVGRTRLMIIDIAGVPAIDTEVIGSLLKSAQALNLLGCQVALTGIAPSVAALLAGHEFTLRGLITARSPQEALARYEAATGNGLRSVVKVG